MSGPSVEHSVVSLLSIGNFFFRHRNWVFPAIVVGCFALAVPPSTFFGSEAGRAVEDAIALLLVAMGLGLRALVIGFVHVSRAGQGRRIHAAILHTDGIFSLCRNPLYTGNILVFTGVFLMHGSIWTMLIGIALFVFIYHALVIAEEDYLTRTFGDRYLDYLARVPRWIPNLGRLKDATQGMRFDPRRVLLVEYPNIGIAVIALALCKFYQRYAEPATAARQHALVVLAGIALLAVAFVLGVRFVKKRRIIVAG